MVLKQGVRVFLLLVSDTGGGYRRVLYPPSFSGIMRGLMRKHLTTDEEKAAKKLANIVSDVRLDLDEVGIHLAQLPNVSIRRLVEIADSAEYEKENKYDREHIPQLF
jgi:hypothetical protein